jgi:hypothetical protein
LYCSHISQVPHPASPTHDILDVFGRIVHAVLESHSPMFHSESHRKDLAALESSLTSVDLGDDHDNSPSGSPGSRSIAELYQLTALVYLERCSGNISSESAKIDKWLQRAWDLLDQIQVCRWPVVHLILGLEARTDEERVRILDLLTPSEKKLRACGMDVAEHMIRMGWVQDDLGTRYVDYVGKMNMLLSSSSFLPRFM